MRRDVGIYPEIKHPRWHHEHGIDLASRLLAALAAHGYSDAGSPRTCSASMQTSCGVCAKISAAD